MCLSIVAEVRSHNLRSSRKELVFMMNRRWFFTASGSAYLAACCSFVGKNKKKAAPDFAALNLVRPAAPDAQFTQVVDRFFIGLDDQLAKMLAMSTSVISDAQLPRDP